MKNLESLKAAARAALAKYDAACEAITEFGKEAHGRYVRIMSEIKSAEERADNSKWQRWSQELAIFRMNGFDAAREKPLLESRKLAEMELSLALEQFRAALKAVAIKTAGERTASLARFLLPAVGDQNTAFSIAEGLLTMHDHPEILRVSECNCAALEKGAMLARLEKLEREIVIDQNELVPN